MTFMYFWYTVLESESKRKGEREKWKNQEWLKTFARDPDKFVEHLPPQTTMPGELWVDTFNNGNWNQDSDEDENERNPDTRALPMAVGGALALFLGIALGQVTATAALVAGAIATVAGVGNPR